MNYIIERLKEKSTWAGIFGIIIALAGPIVSPEQQTALIQAGVAIAGVAAVFVKAEKK